MSRRHNDALHIQQGACNPIAISSALFDACREISHLGGDTDNICRDPAIRLMIHQLVHLTNIAEVEKDPRCYRDLIQQCEEQVVNRICKTD